MAKGLFWVSLDQSPSWRSLVASSGAKKNKTIKCKQTVDLNVNKIFTWTSIWMILTNGYTIIGRCTRLNWILKTVYRIIKIYHYSFLGIFCILKKKSNCMLINHSGCNIVITFGNKSCQKLGYKLLCKMPNFYISAFQKFIYDLPRLFA